MDTCSEERCQKPARDCRMGNCIRQENLGKKNLRCQGRKLGGIIIIIIIIIISFKQGIYTYIPQTNYIPREYSVAAILLLLFMVLISLVSALNLLYFYISTFRSMCAVSNMAVFCSSLSSFIIIMTSSGSSSSSSSSNSSK